LSRARQRSCGIRRRTRRRRHGRVSYGSWSNYRAQQSGVPGMPRRGFLARRQNASYATDGMLRLPCSDGADEPDLPARAGRRQPGLESKPYLAQRRADRPARGRSIWRMAAAQDRAAAAELSGAMDWVEFARGPALHWALAIMVCGICWRVGAFVLSPPDY